MDNDTSYRPERKLDTALEEKIAEAAYWKAKYEQVLARCEAAEAIVAISGVVNCEGYDRWQELKSIKSKQP